jgi:hypothetical protein
MASSPLCHVAGAGVVRQVSVPRACTLLRATADEDARKPERPTFEGVWLADSEGEFRARFGCAPPDDTSFDRERLVVLRMTSPPSWKPTGVVVNAAGAHVGLVPVRWCHGAAIRSAIVTSIYAVAAGPEPLDVELCPPPDALPCPPLP